MPELVQALRDNKYALGSQRDGSFITSPKIRIEVNEDHDAIRGTRKDGEHERRRSFLVSAAFGAIIISYGLFISYKQLF